MSQMGVEPSLLVSDGRRTGWMAPWTPRNGGEPAKGFSLTGTGRGPDHTASRGRITRAAANIEISNANGAAPAACAAISCSRRSSGSAVTGQFETGDTHDPTDGRKRRTDDDRSGLQRGSAGRSRDRSLSQGI